MNFCRFFQNEIILAIKLCLGFGVLAVASPAQSGGFEIDANDNSQVHPTEVNVSEQQKPQSQRQSILLDWRQWGSSYLDGENLCRERNGNIICVTTESANNLHW